MAVFNLADVLRETNAQDLGQKGREQIQYIDIDLIDPDPKNFYELSDLDELAANIELVGLQQPLRVRNHPKDPDRWMIVSGHRRRAAIRQLVDEGKDQFRAVACIVEQPAANEALQELRLIFANSGTRNLQRSPNRPSAQRCCSMNSKKSMAWSSPAGCATTSPRPARSARASYPASR